MSVQHSSSDREHLQRLRTTTWKFRRGEQLKLMARSEGPRSLYLLTGHYWNVLTGKHRTKRLTQGLSTTLDRP